MKTKVYVILILTLGLSTLMPREGSSNKEDPEEFHMVEGPPVLACEELLELCRKLQAAYTTNNGHNTAAYKSIISEALGDLKDTYRKSDRKSKHVLNGSAYLLVMMVTPYIPLPLPSLISKLMKSLAMLCLIDLTYTELRNALLENEIPRRISTSRWFFTRKPKLLQKSQ